MAYALDTDVEAVLTKVAKARYAKATLARGKLGRLGMLQEYVNEQRST